MRILLFCSSDRGHWYVRQRSSNKFDWRVVIHDHPLHRIIIKVCGKFLVGENDFLYLLIGRHRSESQSGSDLNKSKGGDKKQRSSTPDDTQQPGKEIIANFNQISFDYFSGATRKDWNNPNQVVGNDPQYGTGGSPTGADNPSQGKK